MRQTHHLILTVGALIAVGVGIISLSSHEHSSLPISLPHGEQRGWKRNEAQDPPLEIKDVVQHGDIFSLEGVIEPGSMVIVNNEKVPVLFGDSRFRYFVGPLPQGTTIITITVQNDRGGVNTKQLALTVP